jgi:hypothetical protein
VRSLLVLLDVDDGVEDALRLGLGLAIPPPNTDCEIRLTQTPLLSLNSSFSTGLNGTWPTRSASANTA